MRNSPKKLRFTFKPALAMICFLSFSLLSAAPLLADSVLNFPRLSANPDLLTGIAIVNPSSSDAKVTITAYGADGIPFKGEDITNPYSVTVPAGQQFSKLTSELFGSSLPDTSAAWFQATSTNDGLTGFFLFLNSSITLMDGADVPVTSQKIIFNNIRIDSGFTTELNIVNPGANDAHINVQLAGTVFPPAPQSITIPAHGAARLDVASLFSVTDVLPGAYVIVDSDVEICGFELVQSPSGDSFGLNARRGAERLGSLYFLQLSVLGSLNTQIALVNYTADPVVVTITAYKPDGSLYDAASLKDNPVARALNGQASLREDIQSMFGFSGDKPLDGWILVKSTSDAINGFIAYGDSSTGAVAAVTSSAEGRTRALFSHIATTSGFSTGLSLLNPGSVAANVRILAMDKSGQILGVFDTVLQPSQRFNRYLGTSDLIPQAGGQSGGLIFIKSDQPLYMSALIRSINAWVNIPSQPAPDSYKPDSDLSSLKMSPPLAIVPPGSSQRFTVSGSPAGLIWKVNGTAGGSAATGTIASSGVFTAPKSVPARQVVTITAEAASQSAGASADVLDKVPFISGLAIIQSVTFLDTLGKVYSAELAALSSAPSASFAATAGNSQILEISQSGEKNSVALFPGEVIAKIIPFSADDGKQYLLMAAQTSGRIIRLNPVTKEFKYMVSDLNQPSSIVIDPVTSDLLIVEKDKVSSVPKSVLQADLLAPTGTITDAGGFIVPPFASLVLPASGGAGIAVDRCTGWIYYSLADQGTVLQYRPEIDTSYIVVGTLNNPGQILALYRANVTCPSSFQLLIAERGANRIVLYIPATGNVIPWLDSPGITDIAFLPTGNPDTPSEGILLADHTVDIGGEVFLVPLSNLYENKPPNPPEQFQVESKVDLALSQSHTPDPVAVYATLTFTVTITNKGPDPATGVSFFDKPPVDATFLSAIASQGNCGQANDRVNCNIGPIPANGTVTVAIKVAPNYFADTQPRTLRNTAVVTSIEIDTVPSNNTSTDDATVNPSVPAKLELSGLPATVSAASSTMVTVTMKDTQGSVVTTYTGTVHFSSSDTSAILPANYTFKASDAGKANLYVSFRTPGSQTLTVTDVESSTWTSSQTTTVTTARLSSLAITASTSTPSAGLPFSVTVTANDALGYPILGYAGTVRFTTTDTAATSNPSSYVFLPEDQGVHTITDGFTLIQVGSRTITVTDATNPAITASLTLTVGSNQAVSLQVSAAPTSITAGTTTTVTVTAKDAFGNTSVGYTGPVTLSASPSFTGSPAETFTATTPTANGVFTFTATLNLAGSRTINAQGSGTTPISGSTTVTVNLGTTSKLLVTAPASATAGTSVNVTVTASDQYGNTTPNFTGSVQFSSTDPNGTVNIAGIDFPMSSYNNYNYVVGEAGVHTFPVTFKTAGIQIVTVTSSTFTGTSAGVIVNPGLATSFTVTAPTPATAGTPFSVTVTAKDSSGNTATGYPGTVHFTSSDGAAVLPANSTLTNGTGSFSITLKTAGTWTVTATDTVTSTITGASSNITVNPGLATSFIITAPTPATAGTPFSVTVTAKDSSGNTATGYPGTVHFTSSDGAAVLPANSGLTNGTGSFSVTLKTVGTWTVTATDTVTSTITGASSNIIVNPGLATSFIVTAPTPATAGTPFSVTVTAKDSSGNTATGYPGTVHFTSSDGAAVLPANSTLTNGTGSFSVTLKTAGTWTVTATDIVTSSITGASSNITVNPGLAASFTVTAPTPATAGTPFSVAVTAKDSSGNTATGYSGTVHFTSTDGVAVLPANSGLTNGTGSFSVTLKTAGTWTVTATDTVTSTITGTSSNITVNPGLATSFTVTAPTPATAGTPFSVTVTAKDSSGNTAAGYPGTVHITSSDGAAVLPANATLTSGTGSFSVTLKTNGSQTVSATDTVTSTITGTSSNITVNPGLAASFTVTAPTPATAGTAFSVTVTAKDSSGNTATGYAGTVHFTSSDGAAVLPANSTLTNGTGSFSVTLKTAGLQTVSVADTLTPSVSGSTSISVVPAAAAQFQLTNLPSTVVGNTVNPVTVTAIDSYGNIATGYTGTIHFSSNDSSATLPANSTLTNGTGNFNVKFGTTTCGWSWSLAVTDTVNTALTSSLSVVVAGSAYTFGVQLTPSSPVAGVFADIKVTALDICSNVAVGFTGTISFSTSDPNALPNGGSGYTFTLADQGVHNFTGTNGVAFQIAGQQTVTVTGAVNPGSAIVTVLPGPAVSLQVGSSLTFPANPTTPIDVTVTALDQFGNIATGYVGTIHFTTSDPAAATSMPGDFTFLAGNNGVHVFTLTLPCNPSIGTTITATDTVTGFITGTTLTIFPCGG